MKKAVLISILFSLFISCQNNVDYDTSVKDSSKNKFETNNYFITSQDASLICFYKQNRYGDPELLTYERDFSSDTSQTVPKGTSLAQLALKSFEGFKFYTAVQSGDTLNVYYNRLLVNYDFYSSKNNGRHLYNFSGLYGTAVTNPNYIVDSDYYFIAWKDINGNSLGFTYEVEDKKFYPEVLSKNLALGTKGVADIKGDILLDDGSVISYAEFAALSSNDKATIKAHAYAVLICTNYNPDYNTEAVPGNDFFTTLDNESNSLFGGQEKIIAAVVKNNTFYTSVTIPWLSNDDIFMKYPMNLQNYLDGSANTDYIKSLKSDTADYTLGNNAFSACESYGKQFASKTANSDGWYLPSLAELYSLHLLLNDTNYSDLKSNLYGSISDAIKIWSSNVEKIENWTLATQNAYATDAIKSSITIYNLSRDETAATLVLPFRKIN